MQRPKVKYIGQFHYADRPPPSGYDPETCVCRSTWQANHFQFEHIFYHEPQSECT